MADTKKKHVEKYETITLSREGGELFLRAFENPPEPNARLVEAMRLYIERSLNFKNSPRD